MNPICKDAERYETTTSRASTARGYDGRPITDTTGGAYRQIGREIAQSDRAQSRIRIYLGAIFFAYSAALFMQGLVVSLLPLCVSTSFLCLAAVLFLCVQHFPPGMAAPSPVLSSLRFLSVVIDTTATATYIGVSGPYGSVAAPVFLTVIIGYGFRFGVRYFALSMALCVISLLAAVSLGPHPPEWNAAELAAIILSIVLVPLYALSLLAEYQATLSFAGKLSRERDALLSMLSHEIRNPLHAILGIVDSSRASLTEAPRSAQESTLQHNHSRIQDCCEYLLSLADGFIQAKYDEEQRTDAIVSDWNTLLDIRRSISICSIHAGRKGLKLICSISGAEPRTTTISSTQIRTILTNILDNAIKYTENGHVHADMVFDFANDGSGALAISVHDTGLGINSPPKHNTTTRSTHDRADTIARTSGGFGIAIVKDTVRAMGGTVSWVSRDPIGTSCTIQIPFSHKVFEDDFNLRSTVAIAPYDEISLERVIALSRSGVFIRRIPTDIDDRIFDELSDSDAVVQSEKSPDTFTPKLLRLLSSYNSTPALITRSFKSGDIASWNSAAAFEQFEMNFSSDGVATVLGLLNSNPRDDRGFIMPTAPQKNSLSGLRLLVADDSPMVLTVISESLRSCGAYVDTATSRVELESWLENSTYHAIIIDNELGPDNGYQLAKIVKQRKGNRAVVALLTGDSRSAFRSEAANQSVDFVLTKGATTESLVCKLLDCFEGSDIKPAGYPPRNLAFENLRPSYVREIRECLGGIIAHSDNEDVQLALRFLHRLRGLCDLAGADMFESVWDPLDRLIKSGRRVPNSYIRIFDRA